MRTQVPTGYALIEWLFDTGATSRMLTCTLGISVTGTVNQTMCDAIELTMRNAWTARLPNSFRFRGITLYKGAASQPYATFSKSVAIAGTNTNTALDAVSQTHVVMKNTGVAGRYGRGRMFIPGMKAGDHSVAGVIPGATLTTYNTSLATLKANIEAVTGVGDLYLLGHGGHAPIQITSLTMRAVVGTQVRRVPH